MADQPSLEDINIFEDVHILLEVFRTLPKCHRCEFRCYTRYGKRFVSVDIIYAGKSLRGEFNMFDEDYLENFRELLECLELS